MKGIQRINDKEDMSSHEEIEDELESQQIVTGNKRVVPSTRKKRRGMIEKRRRDKINHSLAELRRLVPPVFEKQGSAKLEKAEILQMTVDYLNMLHAKGIIDSLDNNKYNPLQSINDHLSSASPSNQAQQNTANLMLNQSQAQNINHGHHHNHHHQQQQQHSLQQATLPSHANSLQNNILQNQPIDHNNHSQQQHRQNLLDTSSASHASTAATMLSVVPSPSSAVQSSPFTSAAAVAASASHHLYNQHHMSASAAAAYHHLNNPLASAADMAGNMSDSAKHSIKMDPHQSSLVIQHPHHHHPSLLNLDYQHHQAHQHHNPLCTHYGSHHHHHHSGTSLAMSPYTSQN